MKSKLNRRNFLTTLGAGIAAYHLFPLHGRDSLGNTLYSTSEGPDFWVDTRFTEMNNVPWRKVHLDFHNSKHIPEIGEKFNPDKWGDQLISGNVDSIVVFAKDMHGYFYYPSKYGPVHPGLSFDLLGKQVKACQERNIKVYAYYCAAWDHHLAEKYPEWNMRKRDGTDYRPKPGATPGWTALCLGNKDFVDLMVKHVKEYMLRYDLDGAWLDMAEPITPECYCKECLRQIKSLGKDPYDKEVQRAHQNKNFIEFHRIMHELVHLIKPGSQVDFNDIGLSKVSERAHLLDNIDIEALPTGGWGYWYAPAQIRYQRNFGVPVYGMTGRFVSSWADFGGLKLSTQLDVELASIVANAAHCDVGDQMPPNGVLDPAVYHVLGESFGRIKSLESFLDQAAPVTEAALLIPDRALERQKDSFIYGFTKLMIESHLQFDLIERGLEWERYNLVIIPDEMTLDQKSIDRIHSYIANGGAVIISNPEGSSKQNKVSWLNQYGFNYEGESKFKPAYLVTESGFIDNFPGYEYALYNGASQWKVQPPAKSLAVLGEPLFQRSAENYTSHRHTPFDHVTDYAAIARSGKIGLFAFPLGSSYYDNGYWIYRRAFQKLLSEVYDKKLIETNAPLNTEITITYQALDLQNNRPERYMIHLINWSPSRKTSPGQQVHEDPVPLNDIRIQLNIVFNRVKVKTAVSRKVLNHKFLEGGVVVIVPRIFTHEIVCFELL